MEQRSPKTLGYVLFALVVMVMAWETNLNAAALSVPAIPEDAIRIRVLAHSDSPRDQWIKKQIRDAIVAEVSGWGLAAADAEEARTIIAGKLPELVRIAEETLDRYGFGYGAAAELGRVAFPAKVFEGTVYPAGEYEALRITLGDGRGENWWCVLFPPLCFGGGTVKAKETESVSGDRGDAEDRETAQKDKSNGRDNDRADNGKDPANHDGKKGKSAAKADRTGETGDEAEAKGGAKAAEVAGEEAKAASAGVHPADLAAPAGNPAEGDDVEVRFFFADLFKKAADKLKSLFA